MKKNIIFVAAALFLATLSTSAHDFEAVNAQGVTMYFNVISEAERTAAVTFYGDNYSNVPSDKKYSGAVIIPETIVRTIPPAVEGDEPTTATYTVTQVGERAFYGCSGLTEITIPAGITAIGQLAFYNCTGLTALNYNAVNCTMPSSSSYAAFGSAGKYANYVYEMVVHIGEGVETIPAYFGYNMRAKSVYIPSTVTSIGNWSLGSVSGLKEVHIADLAAWCAIDFNNTSSAQPLANSNALLYLGDEQITDLRIPDGVTEIKPYAFYKGTFASIDLNNVQPIGDYAFAKTTGYTALTIGNTVTSIGKYAFQESSVATLNYNNTTITTFNSYNDAPFYGSNITTINLGTDVTAIPEFAFYNCSKLEEITIPERITSIGKGAFSSCSGLRRIYFNAPECDLKYSTGWSTYTVFDGSGSKNDPATLYIGEGVRNLSSYAFCGLNIGSVYLPASVESFGTRAFSSCSCLKNVYITDLSKWCAIDFGDESSNPLYPASSGGGNLYINNVLVEDLRIPDGITEIKPYAFAKINISSLDLNETQTIGKWAFAYAKGFTELTMDDHLTSVGEYAFYYSSIETLNYNNNVIESFPSSNAAFSSSNLKTINWGENVTRIPAYAFQSCSKLTEITIPERITFIGNRAFGSCTGLRTIHLNAQNCTMQYSDGYTSSGPFTSVGSSSNPATVYIAEGITSISPYAFYNSNIGYVYLPSTVENIGTHAFYACNYLKEFHSDITNPADVTLGTYAFYNQSSCKLLVPNSTSALYSVTPQWRDFQNIGEAYFKIVDGEEYVLSEPISHCTVEIERTFNSTNWQAFIVPIDMAYEEWSKYGEVAELTNAAVGADGEIALEWTFVKEGHITAGKPYIFKPSYTGTKTFRCTGDLQPATVMESVSFGDVTVSGTYSQMSGLASAGIYALAGGRFAKAESDEVVLAPLRIYITVNRE